MTLQQLPGRAANQGPKRSYRVLFQLGTRAAKKLYCLIPIITGTGFQPLSAGRAGDRPLL